MRRSAALPLIVLAPLLLAPPPAGALEARAEGPDGPVVPDATVAVALAVTVDCVSVWSRDGATVAVEPSAPDGVTVTGPAELEFPRSDCPTPDGNATREQAYGLRVGPDLPAGLPLTVSLTASLPAEVVPGQSATARVQVVPAYRGQLHLGVDAAVKHADGDRVPLALTLRNDGNGAVRAALSAEVPTGVRVGFPAEVTVPAGGERLVPATIHLPAGAWSEVTARIRVDAVQEGTGAGAETHHASVLVRNGNPAERVAAPGPGAAPALAVLAVAAVLLVRRR